MKKSGIFFVQNGQGMTRIARTSDLAKRMSEWQAASPSPLRVIGKITTRYSRYFVASRIRKMRDARTTTKTPMPYERDPSEESVLADLHRHFSGLRVHGDWYFLDEAVILELPMENLLSTHAIAELVPRATLVWQAVDYAHHKVLPSSAGESRDRGRQGRESLLEAHVINWLTARGRDDISVVLQFDQELNTLKRIACTVDGGLNDHFGWGDHFTDCVTWMVLQGQAEFQSYMEDPALLARGWEMPEQEVYFEPEHEAYFVYKALGKITEGGKSEFDYYYERFSDLMMEGASPEDFAGWDAKRVIAEFDPPCEATRRTDEQSRSG